MKYLLSPGKRFAYMGKEIKTGRSGNNNLFLFPVEVYQYFRTDTDIFNPLSLIDKDNIRCMKSRPQLRYIAPKEMIIIPEEIPRERVNMLSWIFSENLMYESCLSDLSCAGNDNNLSLKEALLYLIMNFSFIVHIWQYIECRKYYIFSLTTRNME